MPVHPLRRSLALALVQRRASSPRRPARPTGPSAAARAAIIHSP